MFIKKDMPRRVDKTPDELPGVRKNHLLFPLRAVKYGLSIWTGYISILILQYKSCIAMLRLFAVRPPRDISYLSLTKPRLPTN